MKIKLFLITLVMTINVFAIDKFKENLNKAKTNLEMKKAAKDLLTAYEKEISLMENKISISFKGISKNNFDNARKDWKKFYLSESRFLGLEFSQSSKYGTSGSLKAKNMKIGLLEKRYTYLKKLEKAKGL